MRGDRRGWYKVSDLTVGTEIARPRADIDATSGTLSDDIVWDEIVSIKPVGREQVYDIEVEGTHNFVGNGIFAHNTYVLRANTMLAVDGEVHADNFVVPVGNAAGATSTSALGSQIPSSVLTADGNGVDLFKLATYNLASVTALAARMDAGDVKVTSLESRVTALESGAIGSQTSSTSSGSLTSSLASALESFGVLIQKGIAQFNTLVFRQLVASKDADGTSSAGSVSILTGNTVAQVNNSLVVPSTKVFITFNSQIAGSWWVSDKQTGSFRVILSEAQTADVSFDYFLVQTEGALATSSPNFPDSPDGQFRGETPKSDLGVSPLNGTDTTPPVITLLGDNPLHISVGGVYVDPGVTAIDSVDGEVSITTFVDGIQSGVDAIDTSSETTHIITYSATDSRGNSTTATRAVIVGAPSDSPLIGVSPLNSTDTVAPVVTLVGDVAMQIEINQTFTDPGATAVDDVDGSLAAVVAGSVDTATEGSYALTYTATDAAGNSGSASRLVNVVAPVAPAETASSLQ